MATVQTGTRFKIIRQTRSATGGMTPGPMVAVNQDITVTFTAGSPTGETKVINGQTYSQVAGTFVFDPDSYTIPYGNSANIKIKMASPNPSPGWRLNSFTPSASNPVGGPSSHTPDANGHITFTDNNSVAGTYDYGIEVINSAAKQYSDSDPKIIQTGGGGDGDDES